MVVVVQVVRVAAHVARHALRRIALPQPGADVDGVVVEPDPDLGLLGGRPPFERLLLHEVGDRVVVVIQPLVQAAVERQWLGQANRPDRHVSGFVTRDHRGRYRFRRAVDCARFLPGRSRGKAGHECQRCKKNDSKSQGIKEIISDPQSPRIPPRQPHRGRDRRRGAPTRPPPAADSCRARGPSSARSRSYLSRSARLAPRRHLRRDVEQERHVRLRQVFLDLDAATRGRVPAPRRRRCSTRDSDRRPGPCRAWLALTICVLPLVAVRDVEQLHDVGAVVALAAQRAADLGADRRVVVGKRQQPDASGPWRSAGRAAARPASACRSDRALRTRSAGRAPS